MYIHVFEILHHPLLDRAMVYRTDKKPNTTPIGNAKYTRIQTYTTLLKAINPAIKQ